MTYACNDCGFLFYRAGAVDACPSCESTSIREATDAEREKYEEIRGNRQNGGLKPDHQPAGNL